MLKFRIPVAAAAVLALGAVSAEAADVKVGSVGGITGPIAELIKPILDGRNMAAKHVNEQGGLLGGNMKLVVADSQCDPKAGVDAGNKVVNVEQVVAIIGASCSGATNGMVQAVSIPAGVVSLSESATAPSITDLKDNDLVFRVSASDAYQGVAIAKLAIDKGFKKVAVSYANDDYNAGIAAVFEKSFKEMGGTVTATQAHEPNKPSYRSEISTLAKGGPEALALFAYYGSSGIAIIRNSLENGFFNKFVGAEGMFEQSVIDTIGADALAGNIWLTQAASDNSSPAFKAFATAYAKDGADPNAPYVAHGYDAVFVMAMAIQKAGAADRSKISKALREVANAPGEVILPGEWEKALGLIKAGKDVNYQGASGDIEFDENGDVPGQFTVNEAGSDGKWHNKPLM